jgi:hypothetical protein
MQSGNLGPFTVFVKSFETAYEKSGMLVAQNHGGSTTDVQNTNFAPIEQRVQVFVDNCMSCFGIMAQFTGCYMHPLHYGSALNSRAANKHWGGTAVQYRSTV